MIIFLNETLFVFLKYCVLFILSNGLSLSFLLYYLKRYFVVNVYIDTAVRIEIRRTPRRVVSWAAPLSQVEALVRVRVMAPLSAEGVISPVAVAVAVSSRV